MYLYARRKGALSLHIQLKILRTPGPETPSFYQVLPVDVDPCTPVSHVLQQLSIQSSLLDVEASPVSPVRWECSCNQGQCGGCAMRINALPRLACTTLVRDVCKREGDTLLLQPLSKFPIVADLEVDRSALQRSLRAMRIWLRQPAQIDAQEQPDQALSASCLQCGCCLEVCPSFTGKGRFYGPAALHAALRIATQTPPGEARRAILRRSQRHGAHDCNQCLACQKVCPAGLPLDVLFSKLNRLHWRCR